MTLVIMRQVSKQRWRLESEAGKIIEDDIQCYTPYDAECWVKAYTSGYQCWEYKIIPLGE